MVVESPAYDGTPMLVLSLSVERAIGGGGAMREGGGATGGGWATCRECAIILMCYNIKRISHWQHPRTAHVR